GVEHAEEAGRSHRRNGKGYPPRARTAASVRGDAAAELEDGQRLAVAFSLFGKAPDLNKLAARAEAAASEGRADEAERLLREIIGLDLSEEQRQAGRRVIAGALLDLGEICQGRNARAEAFLCYRRARELGAPLSPAAWAILAEGYAAR